MMKRSSQRIVRLDRGYIAILLVAVIGTAATTWFVTSLGANQIRNERDKKTSTALGLAKQALIGRASADATLPGSLPCPDLVTHIAGSNMPDDGIADLFAGNNCPNYVGRLPWRTLGLPDLRDADGERLWYSLSPNFRDYASIVHINDATPGTLSISDPAPVTNIVAIIFAPGAPLGTQVRNSPAHQNSVANYLDGPNATGGAVYVAEAGDSNFNDRLMTITTADMMARIERRVANEITAALNHYFLAHSVLPNPASASDWSCQSDGDQNLCLPSASAATGFLPRNISPGTGWPGTTFPAWFNSNWRTSVSYAVAPECTSLPACSTTTFSAMTDAGIYTPKVTLVIGSVRRFTVRAVAR